MAEDNYIASKAFVKQMRTLVKSRDIDSIQQAVQQMQDWMRTHPDDPHVGTALEEFDIMEEAARLIEARKMLAASSANEPVAKAS